MTPPRFPPVLVPTPRRISAWALTAIIVLGTSGVLLLTLFLTGLAGWRTGGSVLTQGRPGVTQLREVVLENRRARDKVVVIDINGVISSGALRMRESMVDSIRNQLDRAAADERVRAVVLRVDSPGGEVLASDEIYQAIRNFQTSNGVPVVASMGSLAASGGYYVSAPCRWIVAHPLTLTGSIGVIFHGYNYRGLLDKVGVLPNVVKSGQLKDMFSGDRRPEDILPEEKLILKDLVMESFGRFKQVIRDGRNWSAEQNKARGVSGGRELASDWEALADGRILSGSQALEAGLVDELGNFDQAVSRAMDLAQIKSANVITYAAPPTMGDLLGLWGRLPAGKVQLEVPGLLPEANLVPGRLYFLSPLHQR